MKTQWFAKIAMSSSGFMVGCLLLGISPPLLTLSLLLQGGEGKLFALVRLRLHAPVCAHAAPLLHEQDAPEQVRLNIEPVEVAHVAGRIGAPKVQRVHGTSLTRLPRSRRLTFPLLHAPGSSPSSGTTC